MKTKFSISNEVYSMHPSVSDCVKEYNEYYKSCGWQIDEDNQEVYMIFDKEINLKEGDRVEIHEIRIVSWKSVNVLEDTIVYELRLE